MSTEVATIEIIQIVGTRSRRDDRTRGNAVLTGLRLPLTSLPGVLTFLLPTQLCEDVLRRNEQYGVAGTGTTCVQILLRQAYLVGGYH